LTKNGLGTHFGRFLHNFCGHPALNFLFLSFQSREIGGTIPGLPDGLFSDQFGYILEDLGMENVVIFYVHLEYFTAIYLMGIW
jgi:hypothetical protein